jgi:hypothetical protein
MQVEKHMLASIQVDNQMLACFKQVEKQMLSCFNCFHAFLRQQAHAWFKQARVTCVQCASTYGTGIRITSTIDISLAMYTSHSWH